MFSFSSSGDHCQSDLAGFLPESPQLLVCPSTTSTSFVSLFNFKLVFLPVGSNYHCPVRPQRERAPSLSNGWSRRAPQLLVMSFNSILTASYECVCVCLRYTFGLIEKVLPLPFNWTRYLTKFAELLFVSMAPNCLAPDQLTFVFFSSFDSIARRH